MVFQNSYIPVLLVLGAFGVLQLVFYLFGLFKTHNKPPERLESTAMRGPGQSLLIQIEAVSEQLQLVFLSILLIPMLISLAHLSYSKFGDVPESSTRTAISLGGGLFILAYYLVKFIRLRFKRRYLRLGYDGEVAVARELNQMISIGYHVYHDFPGDGFNIDHVLIGPAGVMAVETKTLSNAKSTTSNKKTDAVVTYDGRMLHFPKYSDHESIDRAKHQATWLSQWLSSTIGEEVCARAMVALPGWFVKRTSADGIPVVNPKQFETLFKHIKPRPLTDNMIGRIVQQMERHCSEADALGNSCYAFPQP